MKKSLSERWGSLRSCLVFDKEFSGILLVLFILFMSETNRGIVLSTLPAYIFDCGGNLQSLGLALSLFSVGRLVSTFMFGYIQDMTHNSRHILVFAMILSAFGNALYASIIFFPSNRLMLMYFSRFVIGFGSGILSVCRTYLAMKSTIQDRTKVMAWSGFVQYVGFAVTPIFGVGIIQLALVFLKNPKSSIRFTLPPWTLVAVDFLTAFLVWRLMEKQDCPIEPPASSYLLNGRAPSSEGSILNAANEASPTGSTDLLESRKSISDKNSRSSSPSDDDSSVTAKVRDDSDSAHCPRECWSSSSNLQSSSNSSKKTQAESTLPIAFRFLGVPFNDASFALAVTFVFLYLNFSMRGILGVFETVTITQYERMHKNALDVHSESGRYITFLGISGAIVYLLVDPILKRKLISDVNFLQCSVVFMAVGSALVMITKDASFLWFTVGNVLVWCLASPIAQTLTVSTYSKMLGSAPQGKKMGWISTSGGIGRIVFPFLAGYNEFVAHALDISLCVVTVIVLLVFQAISARFENFKKGSVSAPSALP